MKYFNESIIGRKNSGVFLDDLKTGYIVKLNDNNYYFVLINKHNFQNSKLIRSSHNIIISPHLAEYNNQLCSKRSSKYNIIEVWGYEDDGDEDIYSDYYLYGDGGDEFFGQNALQKLIINQKFKRIK